MKWKLKDLFTKEQHEEILRSHPNNGVAAKEYTRRCGQEISRQLVRYWRKIYIGHAGIKARADRELKQERKIHKPSREDDLGKLPSFVTHGDECRRILVIGDLHAPYVHPDALDFLRELKERYNPELVVQIGDEVDNHAISFHDSDPDLKSAGDELEAAKEWLGEFVKVFPEVLVCDSNHGSLVYRKAKAHGLPAAMIRRYRDILFPQGGGEGWSWGEAWNINTVLGTVRFVHQASGDAVSHAAHENVNLVAGHEHGKFGVNWAASSAKLYFGAYTGCLIDRKSLAFAYGKLALKKPILGAMVITDGCPQHIPMLLDADGRWVGR
ncbi:hypothetical protein Ahp1_25 [Aeromonas phage Ahp1]|uniref:Uncharacterized protein n=1 Tax=Aeromonas phage Ahp1 TaxID=1747286 RepID=A0A1S5Q9X1_9CAUD|nr:hypothetical protein HOS19_gp25 [Aeromonas phage Ahp1]ALP47744.1 hypothetical protein Ahp1_25 [Aeromonas phage Ahp1]